MRTASQMKETVLKTNNFTAIEPIQQDEKQTLQLDIAKQAVSVITQQFLILQQRKRVKEMHSKM